MKLLVKIISVCLCILSVGANAYAASSEDMKAQPQPKKIPPSVLADLQPKPTSTIYTTTVPLKTPIHPATGFTPEQPVPDLEGHEGRIPPDTSTGDPRCSEEGYYCKAELRGTSVYCQWGTLPNAPGGPVRDPKDCNEVANYCRMHPDDVLFCK